MMRAPTMPARPDLTGIELAVLIGLANGEHDTEIGKRLHISRGGVQYAALTVRRLLHARTRGHTVALALRCGLITHEDVIVP